MIITENKPQTRTQMRLENLKPARDHYRIQAESIRTMFPFEIWAYSGLNWPQWDKFRVLLCNVYGVSTIDQIPDEFVDSANDFAIKIIDKMFDQNIMVMEHFLGKCRENTSFNEIKNIILREEDK